MDDMLTNNLKVEDHIQDMKQIFDILRKYQIKLSLEKCTFGVSSGKFLGFIVTQKDIETNPEKIKSIVEVRSP